MAGILIIEEHPGPKLSRTGDKGIFTRRGNHELIVNFESISKRHCHKLANESSSRLYHHRNFEGFTSVNFRADSNFTKTPSL